MCPFDTCSYKQEATSIIGRPKTASPPNKNQNSMSVSLPANGFRYAISSCRAEDRDTSQEFPTCILVSKKQAYAESCGPKVSSFSSRLGQDPQGSERIRDGRRRNQRGASCCRRSARPCRRHASL